ncbi:hypothetical protein EF847_01050 [Actinobacteria bacterium YIM 96077]|uniref:Uncharacterized protein n=1 Tax=Phytoactinopolyspora halophila TaxID=1981511 RepID=A0A329R4H0_9ACTN|nr:hypothetical protein [Phytoactinopolyspora halophila]AYY11518.1 hypothetical protein EF847_01050 [Actinobacteria bacterium YIM 96077]RAW17998.1 hypothetical protein DPM12_03955 [Phytoactinopolyspora halophila]
MQRSTPRRLIRRTPRFAVTPDGVVIIRRRPFVATCHALGDAIERLDRLLDNIPAYLHDGHHRRWWRHGQWGCRLHFSRVWLPLQDV